MITSLLLTVSFIAPSYGHSVKTVSSGSETADAAVLASPEGALWKAGAGAWLLPDSFLLQKWALPLVVGEGETCVGYGTAAGSAAAPTTLSGAIRAKALLWVAADDAAHVDQAAGAVSTWYDKRETSTEAPVYCRAASSTAYTSELPTLTTVEGASVLDFGGYGSGRGMRFVLPSGANYASSVAHVFAVHAVSNTYGNIFSAASSSYASPFLSGNALSSSGWKNTYFTSETQAAMINNGRTYLDGERADGQTVTVRQGLQLLEASAAQTRAELRVDGFFCRDKTGNSGGDYLCEALVFTNALSETERVEVEAYLMAKYFPNRKKTIRAEVRAGAAYAIDAAEADVLGETTELTGTGSFIKRGSGDFKLYNPDNVAFDGDIDVKAGAVTLGVPAGVKIAAGQRVTVDNAYEGPRLSVANDADDGVVVKEGSDELAVNGVPNGVREIDVKAGLLTLRASDASTAAPVAPVEITVPNGGFEEFATDTESNPVVNLTGTETHGWTGSASLHTKVFHYDRWTAAASSNMDGKKRETWNVASRPPDGDCALIFKGDEWSGSSARSASIALEAGDYEVQFKMSGRETAASLGAKLTAHLYRDTTKVKDIGKAFFSFISSFPLAGEGSYVTIRMPFTVDTAGNYKLGFAAPSKQTALVIIDDVRLFRVSPKPSDEAVFPIPGGTFGDAEFTVGNACESFKTAIEQPGWTFAQPSGWTSGTTLGVGISLMCMKNDTAGYGSGALFNASAGPLRDSCELTFIRNTSTASTTFTPPAGTWQLRAKVAHFGLKEWSSPKLTATIAAEGVADRSLGVVQTKERDFDCRFWPTSFTVDGETPVTLSVTLSGSANATDYNASGLIADDFELVRLNAETEYVKGGDMESFGASWTSVDSTSLGTAAGIVRSRTVKEATWAFGAAGVKGDMICTLENLSAIRQSVYLPLPGRYRLSYYAHSRLSTRGDKDCGENPTVAWVANEAGTVTNFSPVANNFNADWTLRTFDFDVADAGAYVIGIQGTRVPPGTELREAHIDQVSLRQIAAAGMTNRGTDVAPADLTVKCSDGARLNLDFAGTVPVKAVKVGGRWRTGTVNATTCPGLVTGTGALLASEGGPGMLLIFR